MIYIGIDIAKKTHYASAVNSDGTVIISPFAFSNTKEGFNLFLSKVKNFDITQCLVGLESTGHYADNLVSFLHSNNYKIGIINPIQTDSLRNSNIRKTKNDKLDTFLVAQCLILGKYSLFSEKDISLVKLRSLCRFRFDIVGSRTRLKTQLTTCIDSIFPELYSLFSDTIHLKSAYAILTKFTSPQVIAKTRIDVLAKTLSTASRGRFSSTHAIELKQLAKNTIGIDNPAICIQIRYLIEQIIQLNNQIDSIDLEIKSIMDSIDSPILSIPGVSYTLGSMIISEIGDISRFKNWTKLMAYAGLDPSVKQSGCFCATNTKISKRGSKHLRYAILSASFSVIHQNDTFHNYYTLKRAEGKGHRKAVGHVSGKLIRVIFKILTDNIPFNLS